MFYPVRRFPFRVLLHRDYDCRAYKPNRLSIAALSDYDALSLRVPYYRPSVVRYKVKNLAVVYHAWNPFRVVEPVAVSSPLPP